MRSKRFRFLCTILSLVLLICITGCQPQELPSEASLGFVDEPPGTSIPSTPVPTANVNVGLPTPNLETPEPLEPTPTPAGNDIVPNGVPDDVLPTTLTYEEYKALNKDVVGWLNIAGTQIDYPVVRGSDNEYYLTRTVEKKDSSHGAIFMDWRNADSSQQKHLLIYGHNMRNGTMFHDLSNYKQQDFFDNNRIITFTWGEKETLWEVYAAYVWQKGGAYFHHTRFGSAQNFADVMNSLIEYAKSVKYSVVDSSVTIKASDQVLTLATCTYEYDNSRFVVSARRIQ